MIALIPIPCWRPDAEMLKCRIIAEGANGPTTPDADAIIDARGDIFVIPDILCTAGRRDRQLFRMSAAPSEAIVDEAEILKRLYQILPQFRASDTERRTDGHLEQERRLVDRSPAGPQCQGSQGIVSLRSRPDEARFLPSSGIRSRLCQREAQIRRTLRVTLPKTLRPRQRTCIS
jgi:hypothetical protein